MPPWVGGIYLDAAVLNETFVYILIFLAIGLLVQKTFEQGVAWLTGSYSMAGMPVEEHLCDLYRKWKPDHADCTHVLQLRQVRQTNS